MGVEGVSAFQSPAAEPEIDLGDLCKGLLMGALPVASAVVASGSEAMEEEEEAGRAGSPPMVAIPAEEASVARSPTAVSPKASPKLAHADADALCTPCWGGALKDDGAACSPDFTGGHAHFKNKFCSRCREGIEVPAARVRALTPELKTLYTNTLSSGFWKRASASIGGGDVRIANNTITCDGPWLIVYRDEPLPDLPWAPMPEEWVKDGIVKLSVAKGTLVPVAEMSRKQSGGAAVGPTSAPKRQRRVQGGPFPPAAPPSIRRAASMPPLSAAMLHHHALAARPPPAAPPPASTAASCPSSASSVDDERDAGREAGARDVGPAGPVPATLVLPSPSLSSGSPQLSPHISNLSLASPVTTVATSPAQLAQRLLAAHQQVAALLEQAVMPLSPLRRQLTPEQSTSLLGQLNATRASIAACTQIAKTGGLPAPPPLAVVDDLDADTDEL